MNRPVTRDVSRPQAAALRRELSARGQRLLTNPKNPYIAAEVRTEGRSILTLYTSGKLVLTQREGDAEGAALAALVADVCGEEQGAPGAPRAATAEDDQPAPAGRAARRAAGPARGTRDGLAWLMGCDETGTGELLGRAVVAGVAVRPAAAPALDELAGHVDTKAGRAASGWETLDERLRGLPGLALAALPIPNRLFDAWSKNGLLDLAYVRLVNDLLAAAGLGPRRPADGLRGIELAIDDYGAGELLTRAITAWRGDGAHVVLQHRADDEHLAARAASVLARAARAREFEGLKAEVRGGPIGTGNAGNPQTLRWMRQRAARAPRGAGDGAWPSFVKASFRTARDLVGLPEAEKRRVPPPQHLLDADSAEAFVRGRFDITRAQFRCGGEADVPSGTTRRFVVRGTGLLLQPRKSLAWELLPVLVGGVALSDELEAAARRDPGILDALLDRDTGLLSGWRVLVGPRQDAQDALLVALARAHRAGNVEVVACDDERSEARALARGAVVLRAGKRKGDFVVEAAGE